jgi:hypothetical protein
MAGSFAASVPNPAAVACCNQRRREVVGRVMGMTAEKTR